MAKTNQQPKPTTAPRVKPGSRPIPTTPKELLRYGERPGLSDAERASIGATLASLERLDHVVDLLSKVLNVQVKSTPAPGLEERIGEAVATAVGEALADIEERIAAALGRVLDEAIASAEARALGSEAPPLTPSAAEPAGPSVSYDEAAGALRRGGIRAVVELEDEREGQRFIAEAATRVAKSTLDSGGNPDLLGPEARAEYERLAAERKAADTVPALSPEATAVMAATRSVKRWQDLVPFYHAALRHHAGDIGEPWPRIHAAIIARWSTRTRDRIKEAAWKLEKGAAT
jgi:hypothetical protein